MQRKIFISSKETEITIECFPDNLTLNDLIEITRLSRPSDKLFKKGKIHAKIK